MYVNLQLDYKRWANNVCLKSHKKLRNNELVSKSFIIVGMSLDSRINEQIEQSRSDI